MNRHLVRAGLAAAATIAGLAGCQPKPAQPAQGSPVQQQSLAGAKPVETGPTAPAPEAPAAPQPGTSEALAQKTQNWAQEMAPLINKRPKHIAEPPNVDFLDPGDFRIGPAAVAAPALLPGKKDEAPVQVVQIAHPTVDSTQTLSNQRATIASAQTPGENNYPRTGVATSPRTAAAAAVAKDANTAGNLDLAIDRNLRENPKETWAQLDYQLLQFLKDKPTPQLEAMGSLSNEDRELVAAVMDGLSNFRNGIRADSNMLMSRKVRPFLELADRLRAQADLTIPTLALCSVVEGFASYTPIEPRFVAMKENKVIVYCEVENFASHLNDKKMWETKLSQEMVLYTETGLPVWQVKAQTIPDLARNRRHDFYLINKTAFPPNITVGRYLLKVTVVDQQASRVAEATLPVRFVAQ
jgi:hypothetical protein